MRSTRGSGEDSRTGTRSTGRHAARAHGPESGPVRSLLGKIGRATAASVIVFTYVVALPSVSEALVPPGTWKMIAVSYVHTCGIASDDTERPAP